MTSFDTRSARALAVAATATLLLSGCSLLGGLTNQTLRDDDGTVIEGNDDASAFDIAVGDCLGEPDGAGDVVETVPIVPCTESHTYEAYSAFQIDDGAFPGLDAITAEADQGCYEAFEGFVGVSYESSMLEFTYYYPTEESWNGMNDREVLCLVFDPAGDVTGSLEAAGR